MVKHTLKRGFTLIELLVVIAIIGILASVVLASLNSARSKGADAAVKSNVNNARAQAELFYSNANNYTTVCASGTNNISTLAAAADSANGAGTVTCSDSADAWALSAQLSTGWYCVDNDGRAASSSANLLADTSGYDCQ